MSLSTKRHRFTNSGLVAVATIIAAGFSNIALGATESYVRCDKATRNLASLEVPTEALSVSRIEHSGKNLARRSLEADNASQDLSSATSAPLLYLTPRIASLLRAIFLDDDSGVAAVVEEAPSRSPVATSKDEVELPDQTGQFAPTLQIDEELLPLYQQQMYRKDI